MLSTTVKNHFHIERHRKTHSNCHRWNNRCSTEGMDTIPFHICENMCKYTSVYRLFCVLSMPRMSVPYHLLIHTQCPFSPSYTIHYTKCHWQWLCCVYVVYVGGILVRTCEIMLLLLIFVYRLRCWLYLWIECTSRIRALYASMRACEHALQCVSMAKISYDAGESMAINSFVYSAWFIVHSHSLQAHRRYWMKKCL